jgi:hypothetical protein
MGGTFQAAIPVGEFIIEGYLYNAAKPELTAYIFSPYAAHFA